MWVLTVNQQRQVLDENDATGPANASLHEANLLKVLIVSSSGGHWSQMLRLLPAFDGMDISYACTGKEYRETLAGDKKFFAIPDASMDAKLKLIWQALNVFKLLLQIRPDVVVSTGASSGFFALMFAKKMGKKTIWIDSLANVDKLSMSGRRVAPYADMYLTQWQHLARPEGPHYLGSVL